MLILLAGCAALDGTVRTPDTPQPSPVVDETDTIEETDAPAPPQGPIRYEASARHSPIVPELADEMLARLDGEADVFMKIGDSITVWSGALTCFDESTELEDHSALQPTLVRFLAGDAAGTTPFARDSDSAEGGRTAYWAITGDPSPLDQELAALDAAFAFVQYGTNDMKMGTTHASAMPRYYESMSTLLDILEANEVLPILVAIPPTDRSGPDLWVSTYNDVIRGLAESRRLPWVNLHDPVDTATNGVHSDGIHLSTASGGACRFDEAGLEHGNNLRNLLLLEALDRLSRGVIDGEPLETEAPRKTGSGTPEDPRVIASLPWSDSGDTALSTVSTTDRWDCAPDTDESGPEVWYDLELEERTPLRLLVNDREEVDVDLHLLAEDGSCIARAHRVIETTLDPGRYTVVVDTWSDGTPQAGAYLLTATRCWDTDPDCLP